MQIFSADRFRFPLPVDHRFPESKYALLRRLVEAAGLASGGAPTEPDQADDEALARAHAPEYVRAAIEGTLPDAAWRRIGFPWSPEFAERSRRSVGGTVAACRAALTDGVSVHLAGGTHHAFRDRGEGYCVFNDAAVAARTMQAEGFVRRVVVIDCDVHQGNGTASIFRDDPSVFTLSIHGAKNFPFRKERSDLDVALPSGTGDAEYLAALDAGLDEALSRARADLAIYIAGADAWEKDRLGKLALTAAGMAERDRRVFAACRAAGLPVAVAMGGGYARDPSDTARIHLQTVLEASRLG
ncbi:MAG: histone deacetylase [Acidobacteria bacterium]|jgi:acetoin utilization deacetylase AcuC-like enzyme|nr:histone deacetylase [Acidobacteriota bacterium]